MDKIKTLRAKTGAGIMDAKRALETANGDMQGAEDELKKKGLANAAKKAGREAKDGSVYSYVHGGRIGVLLEVNCETDFVGRTEDFQQLVRDIAQHIVGVGPKYVRAEDIPADEFERERRIHDSDAEVERKLALLSQPFVRDPKRTIGEMVQEAMAKLGENIVVRRFVRYERGESLTDESPAELMTE